ncbi:MAG: HAMP domain-containing sensor histidine kinase, partial [Bauldia litoralis]
ENGSRRRLGMPIMARSLSARLLVLTVLFVMLCEIFVYVPSIARYRMSYLKNAIADAHLAMLSLEAAPEREISPNLTRRLLREARAHVVVKRVPDQPKRMLIEEMPPTVSQTFDLRESNVVKLIWAAFATLAQSDDHRVLRIIDTPPTEPTSVMEILIDEAPMRQAMLDYSSRILILSLLISFFTATLVFFSLHWLLIRPLRRLTHNMVDFRDAPAEGDRRMVPSGRTDEIGVAEQELRNMQSGLRAALKQNARLAALGAAVTKINHDLRNMLASAQLVSDRLATSDDPHVKRVVPTLVRSIDRAVRLCTQTLDFSRGDTDRPKVEAFALDELVEEVFAAQTLPDQGLHLVNRIEPRFVVTADRGQIYRLLANLVRNALQAGADEVSVNATRADRSSGGGAGAPGVTVTIADNGPGVPAPVRKALFEPFHASATKGGSGLGLAIAREIAVGHGGTIELIDPDAPGARFRFTLPNG